VRFSTFTDYYVAAWDVHEAGCHAMKATALDWLVVSATRPRAWKLQIGKAEIDIESDREITIFERRFP
jgi:hypothetical protein